MPKTHSDYSILSPCTQCEISRRRFVSTTALASMAALMGACGSGNEGGGTPLTPPPNPNAPPAGTVRSGNTWTINVGSATELSARGFLILIGAARPALVVRRAADSYAVHDAACPHAGSVVFWQVSGDIVRCTNHGSEFALATGAVAKGPAASALGRLPSSRLGDTITVNAG